ncbi:TrmH family RNA methyltransferase [Piscinibacter sakaiensis]|uniref:TrmH family RNA methyltransferase n=1 Tax=Piscinibacter sakaiensis TaxID=1547922 RepID=UPI003AACDB5B
MSAVRQIQSRSNPQWQRLRKLAQKPVAYRTLGEVWVEGEHLCGEVVRRGQPMRCAVVGESAWEQPVFRELAMSAPEVLLLPDALLAALSSMDSAPPIAMVLPLPDTIDPDPAAPTVVLDRLQDAGNVGTILRSAAAFGFTQVLALKGSAALWAPKVLRAGMGAHFVLRLVEGCEPDSLDQLKIPLLATSSHAAEKIDALPLPWPCGWVLGHEGQGLAAEVSARCERVLRIAQPGGMESLNVAAAATVCLYESSRQRQR